MMLTDWYPTGTAPARDGVYIVRTRGCDCQHLCRWHGQTGYWYSAGSVGAHEWDVIGWQSDKFTFQWRGLAQEPKP